MAIPDSKLAREITEVVRDTATDGNLGRTPTYFPNSRNEWIDQPQLNEPPLDIDGVADHWDHRVDDDH